MPKDPAFLFYTGDFSTGTQFFTDSQVGIYLRLLMAQHQHGHLSVEQVNHISKTHDPVVMKKFKVDADGNFYNERLELEIERRKKFTDSRSSNKLGKKKSYDNHMKKTRKSYVNHMENEDESKSKKRNKKEIADIEIVDAGFPFQSDEAMAMWVGWKRHRKEKRKPYTPVQIELEIEDITKNFNERQFIEAVKHSIKNGYQGLYKPNQNNGSKQHSESFPGATEFIKQSGGKSIFDSKPYRS